MKQAANCVKKKKNPPKKKKEKSHEQRGSKMNGGINYNKSDLLTSNGSMSEPWGRARLTGPNFGPTFCILSAAREMNTVTHKQKEIKC